MNLNQIIKVIFAGIFTFLVIGSLSSISNSIFLEKVIDNLSTLSTAKLNKLREEFFNIQSSLDENKKILTHTVVGREELLELINEQEVKLNELSYLTSADAASEHLQKLNNDLKLTKEALSHSVMGREELKRKIEQTKSEISSFIKIMPSSENLSMAKINEEETKPSVEKVVVVEKPKLTFEEELALASVEAGLKLSKKCTACHSLKSGGPNGVGPTLWNIVNAPKASIDGYSYSNGLSSIGGSWTVQDLNMWLKSPKKYAPGNKMSFAGLRKAKDRANMVAFLNSISDKPIPNNGLN
tara:strand:+ start:1001 stop:1894 length:894 start_codon:yes stop_codon:yes gene_type:complete